MSVVVNVVGKYDDKQITKAQADLEKLKRGAHEMETQSSHSFDMTSKAHKAMAAGIVAAGALASEGLMLLADKAIEFGRKSIEAYSDLGAEVRGVQRVVGGSAEAASHIVAAFKMTGQAVDTSTASLARMERHAATNDKAWQTIGVAARDAHGKMKPMADLLPKVMDRFASLPAGAEKSALAILLFGKNGTTMLPFLNKGSAGMKALAEESDALGTTLSGKDLQATLNATIAKRKFGEAVEGVQVKFGKGLFPVLTSGMEWLTTTGIPVIQSFASGMMDRLKPAIQVITDLWNNGLHQALIDAMPTMIKVYNFVSVIWSAGWWVLAKAVQAVVAVVLAAVNTIGDSVVRGVNIAIDAFNALAAAYNNTVGKINGTSISPFEQLHWTNVGQGGGGGTAGETGYMSGTNGQVPKYTPAPKKAPAPKAPAWSPNLTSVKARRSGGGGGGKKTAKTATQAKMTMAQMMAEALSGAQKVLDSFHARGQAVLDFINAIKASTVSFGAVTQWDKTTANGGVVGQMAARVKAAQDFVKDITALRKLGLNNASLQEIIGAGPTDGDAIAKALLSGGLAAVSQVNSLEKQLNDAGSALGDQGALSQFGMDGAHARGMVNTTVKIEKGAFVINHNGPADKDLDAKITKTFNTLLLQLERKMKAAK